MAVAIKSIVGVLLKGDLYQIIEKTNGDKQWRKNGQLHREGDLPAFEGANGDRSWWLDGKRSRGNGLPAFEGVNGDKHWMVDGQLHREDGLPAIVRTNGHKSWWVNGVLHRNKKPAIVNQIFNAWYTNGQYQRRIQIN